MKGLKKSNGFTTIEMIAVIVILGILSVAAYIKWSDSGAYLDQQIAIIASDLRYAQNLSVARNERCRLKINFAGNSYQILDSENNPLPLPARILKKGLSEDQYTTVLEQNISFKQPMVGFTDTIIFDGKGTPYKDTILPYGEKLDINAVITLQNPAGQTRELYITKETGKISMYTP